MLSITSLMTVVVEYNICEVYMLRTINNGCCETLLVNAKWMVSQNKRLVPSQTQMNTTWTCSQNTTTYLIGCGLACQQNFDVILVVNPFI